MDLNCDLGEGIGKDNQIMPYIGSCNIACGMHAGNNQTMLSTVLLAKKHGVKIGAHPSFPDRENFGREEMFIPRTQLKNVIIKQISLLEDICKKEGMTLHHVKPHGALYNMAVNYNQVAMAIIEAIVHFDDKLILYAPYGSLISRKAKDFKIPVFYEAFVDRNYNDDLTLISRNEQDSLLDDTKIINNRVLQILEREEIVTKNGKTVKLKVDTICVHGDNANVVEIVKNISELINSKNWKIIN